MRISEFCKTFQISHQAVHDKMKNHAAELEGHITKDDRNVLDLDSFAVELAVSIREKQLDIYRTPVIHYPTYAEVKKSFETLNFIHSNHIHSLDDMKSCLAAANRKEDIALHKYCKCAEKKEQLKTLNYLGDEYACLLKTENRDEAQQKRLEKLHWQLVESGGIGGWNTHEDNWLPKLKEKLKNDLKELDSLGAELGRTSTERTEAEAAYEYLQDFLKTDYDKIREQENFRIQIEKYHEGLELQEDGTYKAEPGPTAERNAELAYIAVRDEQHRKYEQRIRDEQMRREKSRRYNDFER